MVQRSDIKIFGVGLQKTGQTSLLSLMKRCGLNARGTKLKLRRSFFRKQDYDFVLAHYDTLDFHCDWPTPLMYKAAFAKYGKRARFILTMRENADVWFESLKRHNQYAHPIMNKHKWVFGRYYPHGFDLEHKAYYEQHAREVQDFFAEQGASDQLLVLRVDDHEAIKKLSRFLGIEIPFDKFPRKNVSARNRRDIGSIFKWNYNRVAQPVYERLAPRLSRGPARQTRPIGMDGKAD